MQIIITLLSVYIGLEFILWIHRAWTMTSSIKKYSIMPAQSWDDSLESPKVSLIIPCRNEEKNLPYLLPTLEAQDYPNLEVILIDDRSEDNTWELMRTFKEKNPNIVIIKGKQKPNEWTGKVHALHQAVERATGEWLLFSDADTQHQKHSVSSAMKHAMDRKIDFLTLTSHYLCKSFSEYLVQPMAIGCFAVWFRLQDVNNPDSHVPLACGHFILMNQITYKGLGGMESIREEVLEDMALFKKGKKDGRFKLELAIGSHVFATRMYDSFGASWNGWRRIFMHSLEQRAEVFVSKIMALTLNSLIPSILPPILLIMSITVGSQFLPLFWASSILLGFIYFLRSKSHQAIKAPFWPILFHPVSACIMIGIIVDCLIHLLKNQKVGWKGEKY